MLIFPQEPDHTHSESGLGASIKSFPLKLEPLDRTLVVFMCKSYTTGDVCYSLVLVFLVLCSASQWTHGTEVYSWSRAESYGLLMFHGIPDLSSCAKADLILTCGILI